MTDISTRIACWLLPSAADEQPLQARIDQLADRYGTARFTPHLTLLVRPEAELEPLQIALKQINQFPVLQLQAEGSVYWSTQYNRALVQPFALTTPLADLIRHLAPDRRLPAGYDPHLSLLYGDLDERTGQQLCREVQLAMPTITFDRVRTMRIGPQTRSAVDVAAWQTLATIPLKK